MQRELPRRYALYGLAIASEIDLPELPAVAAVGEVDVHIRVRQLPPGLPTEAGPHRPGEDTLLVLDGVGRYLARGGRELLVEPAPGVPPRNLRLFLFGSAMAMLLHQRGVLTLHANAVAINGRAYAFAGPSGSGKSTLAAWFADHGFALLSDDVSAIDFDEAGTACVSPGLPRLRLWRDAVERSGRYVACLHRSYEEDSDAWEKYDVPLANTDQAMVATPLHGVFLLERGVEPRLERLSSGQAVATLFSNLYRGEYLAGSQQEQAWRSCLRIAQQVPVGRWLRPWDAATLDTSISRLIDDLNREG